MNIDSTKMMAAYDNIYVQTRLTRAHLAGVRMIQNRKVAAQSMIGHRRYGLAVGPLCAAIILMLGVSPDAHALSFKPSETEWATWPDYCRARYVVSGAGSNSNFANRISSGEVKRFKNQLSERAWHWLHHYCAGLAYLSRAKAESRSLEREYLFDAAKSQMMGPYQRVPRDDPFFGIVATSISQVHRAQGEFEEALEFTNESISAQPSYVPAYLLASLIYREQGQLQKALKTLRAADAATSNDSAEIHYFLGLYLIEHGDIDGAKEHAERAYALGYPLPGLAAKLERLGRPLP